MSERTMTVTICITHGNPSERMVLTEVRPEFQERLNRFLEEAEEKGLI